MSKQQYKNEIIHNKKAAEELHECRLAKVKGILDTEPNNPLSQHEMKLTPEDIKDLIGNHNTDHIDYAKD